MQEILLNILIEHAYSVLQAWNTLLSQTLKFRILVKASIHRRGQFTGGTFSFGAGLKLPVARRVPMHAIDCFLLTRVLTRNLLTQ